MIYLTGITMKTGQDKFMNIPDAYIQKIFQTASW